MLDRITKKKLNKNTCELIRINSNVFQGLRLEPMHVAMQFSVTGLWKYHWAELATNSIEYFIIISD